MKSWLEKKLPALGLQLYYKKRLWHSCFPVNFAKFLRTPFFTEHLRTTASILFPSKLMCFISFVLVTYSKIFSIWDG